MMSAQAQMYSALDIVIFVNKRWQWHFFENGQSSKKHKIAPLGFVDDVCIEEIVDE